MSFRRISQVAFALLAAACAGERTPIDRTQPNALDKEVFQGEWYFGQTVVDIPGTLSPTFVGENTFQGMERIRWDVQEDWLYARRSYERIKGAEGSSIAADGSTPDGRPYLGAVIAAYKVVSHFDIRRAYNPTTGEEYNVLEENTTDRPWHERRYMRVDWSQNHATNFEFLVDDVQHDAVAYYVQDPSDPDYPVIDAGELDAAGNMLRQPYIDVTNVLVVKPGMTYIPEIDESYPTCWLFGHDNDDCTAQPIKLRNSFRKAPGVETPRAFSALHAREIRKSAGRCHMKRMSERAGQSGWQGRDHAQDSRD